MIRFIVDSTFGITKEFADANGIKTVGLTLLLDGKEYTEGFRESWNEFYSDYAKSKSIAKTSQPSPKKFMEAIDEILKEDANSEIIILTIGDRLSGTIGSAQIAALQYPANKIAAVNSFNASVSAVMVLQELMDAAKNGATFEEVVALADDVKMRASIIFIPASLTELARGGRVNKLLSRIGNILKIKPVFEYTKNELSILAKALGTNRAIATAIEKMPKKFDRLAICYIGDDRLVQSVKDRLTREFGIGDIDVEPMCPVAGAHIGIGTVGIVTLASKA